MASILHELHPNAGVWVSAQDLSGDQFEAFWSNVSTAYADGYLAGVVFGPHVRVSFPDFVARAQQHGRNISIAQARRGIPVRQYPDITHTLSSQFPISGWHSAWSLTHGRQTVCPLPQFSASIIRLRSNGSTPNVGVGAYSEGLGDDLNKVMWSAMAEDATLTPEEITAQYARYFFGAEKADVWVKALAGLERNWQGTPGSNNVAIPQTLALLEHAVLGATPPLNAGGGTAGTEAALIGNVPTADTSTAAAAARKRATMEWLLANSTDWRAQMYLKRGYYDAYVQGRYQCEVEGNVATAYAALAKALSNETALQTALAAAAAALKRNCTTSNTTLLAWRKHVVDLTAALNRSVGVEVVGNQDVGLNVETIDTPISDAAFLLAQIGTIASMPSTLAQMQAVVKLVRWTDAGPGGFYDYLGAPGGAAATAIAAPHLNRGEGFDADPGYYLTPLIVGPTPQSADFTQRLAWSTMAMSFFDPAVVVLSYHNLSPTATYVAEVVFNAEREPAAGAGGGGGGGGGGDGRGGGMQRMASSSDPSSHRHGDVGQDAYSYGEFQLLANGNVQVWPKPPLQYALPPTPMQVTRLSIPMSETAGGNLTLSCRQPPGLTGNGRTCQITEVWLKLSSSSSSVL